MCKKSATLHSGVERGEKYAKRHKYLPQKSFSGSPTRCEALGFPLHFLSIFGKKKSLRRILCLFGTDPSVCSVSYCTKRVIRHILVLWILFSQVGVSVICPLQRWCCRYWLCSIGLTSLFMCWWSFSPLSLASSHVSMFDTIAQGLCGMSPQLLCEPSCTKWRDGWWAAPKHLSGQPGSAQCRTRQPATRWLTQGAASRNSP